MSDIFISYAKEDREQAKALAQALGETGWSVFWDRSIPPGLSWHQYIGKELQEARCVVVMWSDSSITSNWVLEEAGDAQSRGVLLPVVVSDVQPPLGFRMVQALDFSGWDGAADSPVIRQLVKGMQRLLGSVPSQEEEAATKAEEEKEKLAADASRKDDEKERERQAEAQAKNEVEEKEGLHQEKAEASGRHKMTWWALAVVLLGWLLIALIAYFSSW